MSPHTDPGALLKQTVYDAALTVLETKWPMPTTVILATKIAEAVIRQAASQGGEGGERSEVQTTEAIVFWYKNYKGEEGYRRAVPISIRYGTSDYHHSPQWLMLAFDTEKQAEREFAMSDMTHNLLGDQIKLGFAPAAQGCAKCGGVNCRDCGKPIDVAYILQHPRSCIVCDPEFGDPRDSRRPAQARLDPRIEPLRKALIDITKREPALRMGGPAPEDLEELSDALDTVVRIAAMALDRDSSVPSAHCQCQPLTRYTDAPHDPECPLSSAQENTP